MGRSSVPLLLGVLCSVELWTAAEQALEPTCSSEKLKHPIGTSSHDIYVNGTQRRYVLHVPSFYSGEAPLALWILAPGAFNEPEKQMQMSETVQYAEEQQVAVVALKGKGNLMNVFLHGQPHADQPDDVAYTEAVLDEVSRRLCVDPRRIYCTGYSRGARFCMLLASQLSERIAAVAPVGGIRFPEPNNATRKMPILAFHGTKDPVNPYAGHGNPEYWDDPVDTAVAKWVHFNGCSRNESSRLDSHIVVERHLACTDNADVVLVRVEGGGHVWPGSHFGWDAGLGHVTHQVQASVMMGQFFMEHPLPSPSQPTPRKTDEFPVYHRGPEGSRNHLWLFFALPVAVVVTAIVTACACILRKGRDIRIFTDCREDSSDEDEDYEESALADGSPSARSVASATFEEA